MARLAMTAPGGAVARMLTAGTAVVVLAFLVVFSLHRLTALDLAELKTLVDIGGEANLPTWWNSSLLATVAVAAIIAAGVRPTPGSRRGWQVVAAAAAYLSVDEAAGLHERLGSLARSAGVDVPTYAWVVPGSALAVVGCTALVWAGRRLPRPTAVRLGGALVLYVGAAVGLETVNGLFSPRLLDWELAFAAGTTVEETLEMLACVVAITAIVDDIVGRHGPALDAPPVAATGRGRGPAADV